jgi:hypothetical protein
MKSYSQDAGRQARVVSIQLFTVLLGALLLGSLAATPAHAGNMNLIVNGKAKHTDTIPGVKLNENNWGLGLQYDLDPVRPNWIPFVAASGFRDSNNNPSYYMGAGMMRRFALSEDPKGLHADVGAIAFVMKRELFRHNDWFPAVLPAFSMGTERVAVNVTYIPKADPKSVPLWYFQLKIGLGK